MLRKSPIRVLLAKWANEFLSFCRPQKKLLSFAIGQVVICNQVCVFGQLFIHPFIYLIAESSGLSPFSTECRSTLNI